MGTLAAKKVKPKSLKELAIANSLMRLMSEGEEQPIDTYVKYKEDINLWYEEMRKFGLNEEEIKILEYHLLPDYGVSAEQESVMKMTMDKKISGFSVKEANGLRKAIAKKKPKLLEETKQLFYKKGIELHTRRVMLDYIWDVQFKRQFGLT
jgi:DNA polymerase-3 subunit alpha